MMDSSSKSTISLPLIPTDTLLQRNESGDLAKAIALLDESLAIFSELRMRLWITWGGFPIRSW